MAIPRIAPQQYFENGTLQDTGANYTPWFIFGGICIVAIVALVIACTRK